MDNSRAVLRLATGLGLSALIAYGLALPLPFVSCVLAVIFLCKPGPPMPLLKGLVVGAVVAGVLLAGVLMVPLLRHYALSGVLLTAALFYAVTFAGARKANPLTMILVVALVVIPVAGIADQALITALSKAFGVGLGTGVLVSGVSHALFPDPPRPGAAAAPRAPPSAQAARRSALQATLVVMPMFVVALSNPPLYIPTLMKAVALGQQAAATNARAAGRELVGSTLMGALMAMAVWAGLTIRPNLWMLMLWLTAAGFWAGARLFRTRATSLPPSFWVNALVTMLILLGPGIEDAAVGKDVYLASAVRVALYIALSFYAWAMVWGFERWFTSSPEPLPRP
jgi:hypothetical protein